MTQTKIKEIIEYCPATGKAYWKIAVGNSTIGKELTTTTSDNRYIRVTIEGTEYLLHRLIYLYMTGTFPNVIDHIDGNSFNNKWDNLRNVTNQINLSNRKMLKNNTSGTTGVIWDKSRNKWKVTLSGKNLGRFSSKEEAIACREAAVKANINYTDRHGRKDTNE